jgi:hypothetical protein
MATKGVATEGDVTATAGTTPYTGASSGTWTAGSVSCTSYAKLHAGGAPAISEATCTFNFAGTSASNSADTGSETVTLRAGPTTLQGGASGVLLDGDSKTDSFGNKLAASSAAPLKTE